MPMGITLQKFTKLYNPDVKLMNYGRLKKYKIKNTV